MSKPGRTLPIDGRQRFDGHQTQISLIRGHIANEAVLRIYGADPGTDWATIHPITNIQAVKLCEYIFSPFYRLRTIPSKRIVKGNFIGVKEYMQKKLIHIKGLL